MLLVLRVFFQKLCQLTRENPYSHLIIAWDVKREDSIRRQYAPDYKGTKTIEFEDDEKLTSLFTDAINELNPLSDKEQFPIDYQPMFPHPPNVLFSKLGQFL